MMRAKYQANFGHMIVVLMFMYATALVVAYAF